MGTHNSRSLGSTDSQRRVCDPFRSQTPSLSCSHRSGIGSPCSSRSNSNTAGQTGGRKGTQSDFAGFLQSPLPGPQEERRLPARHRSVHPQYLSGQSTFQDGNPASIMTSIRPGHWGVSLDLSDAYFHVPIHPRCRKYLRFCHNGKVFQFRAMPFGLATAPRVFTKLMAAVGAFLRLQGTVLLQYFDDWLLHQLNRQVLLQDLRSSWDKIQSLGLLLNPDKSELIPSQDFTFVGMNFLTHLDRVRVPPPRAADLIHQVLVFSQRRGTSAREFLSLLGMLSAASALVHLGRLQLRPLQFYLADRWSQSRDSLDSLIVLDESILPHLQWWLEPNRLQPGVPLTPRSHSLQCDHRCKPLRLGNSPRASWSHDIRSVGFHGSSSAHQQSGDEGSQACSRSFSAACQGSVCSVVVGQHHCCVLHPETGGELTPGPCSKRPFSCSTCANN